MEPHWVIRSFASGESMALYWSNEDGWVDRPSATVFSEKERLSINIPIAGTWQEVCGDTEKMEAAYLANGGSKCIFCSSSNIDAGPYQADSRIVWCEVTCDECGSTWQDHYTLTRVVDICINVPPTGG